jgi:hypothetical protein
MLSLKCCDNFINGVWYVLWSNGQSSLLHIQRSGFDSRRCQIFWEVVGLERGPLSLVSTIEELLGLESRDYCRRDPSRWPRSALDPQKLSLTSPTSSGLYSSLSDQATELFFLWLLICVALEADPNVRTRFSPTRFSFSFCPTPWHSSSFLRPLVKPCHLCNGGMHLVARIIKSQDKPSFTTSIVCALFRVLYAHNMFRLLPKAIFRWY